MAWSNYFYLMMIIIFRYTDVVSSISNTINFQTDIFGP